MQSSGDTGGYLDVRPGYLDVRPGHLDVRPGYLDVQPAHSGQLDPSPYVAPGDIKRLPPSAVEHSAEVPAAATTARAEPDGQGGAGGVDVDNEKFATMNAGLCVAASESFPLHPLMRIRPEVPPPLTSTMYAGCDRATVGSIC